MAGDAGWAFYSASALFGWLTAFLIWLAQTLAQLEIGCQISVWLVTPLPGYQTLCSPVYNAESHRGEGSQITKSFFWTAPYMNEELGIRKQNNKPLQPLNIIIYKTGENDADCQS